MSTHGEGEPTDNVMEFYKYFGGHTDASKCDNLKSLRYTAFALGNRQYEHFCEMGKWIDDKCSSLGATRLYELGLGDDDEDLEGDFEKWREGLWAALSGKDGASAGAGAPPALSAPPAQFEVEWLSVLAGTRVPKDTLTFLQKANAKHQLFECAVGVNRELCQQPQHGSVKHVEFGVHATKAGGDMGDLSYKTADDLAVCCDNGTALATRVATRLGLDRHASFALKPLGSNMSTPLPTPCTVEQALRFHTDVRAPVSKEVRCDQAGPNSHLLATPRSAASGPSSHPLATPSPIAFDGSALTDPYARLGLPPGVADALRRLFERAGGRALAPPRHPRG